MQEGGGSVDGVVRAAEQGAEEGEGRVRYSVCHSSQPWFERGPGFTPPLRCAARTRSLCSLLADLWSGPPCSQHREATRSAWTAECVGPQSTGQWVPRPLIPLSTVSG